jgi:hypothetical protein
VTLDRNKLAKLMRMTESSHDGEALNALRLANAMLKADGKNWSDILAGPTTRAPDYRTPPSKRGAGDTSRYGTRAPQGRKKDETRWIGPEIDPMLDALSRGRHDLGTMTFIASLRDFWERRGFLTTDQYNALKGMHANAERGGGRGGYRF